MNPEVVSVHHAAFKIHYRIKHLILDYYEAGYVPNRADEQSRLA